MKTLVTIVRILLGVAFVFFGANAFHPFMKQGPPPTGPAGDFINAMAGTHYLQVVAACQVIGGLFCLLSSRLVPIGLLFLGPVIVNILCFHIFLLPKGKEPGIVAAVLALFLLWAYRDAFLGLIRPPKVASAPKKTEQ